MAIRVSSQGPGVQFPRWVCAVSAAGMLSTAGIVPAHAADGGDRSPSSANARSNAKAEYARGRKLLEQKRYAEALDAFRAAHAQAPSASSQEQIAYVLFATGELAGAHAAYAELLGRHADGLDRKRRERAERALRELNSTTGAVEIAIGEPGAAVQIDGAEIGLTPLAAPLRMARGAHTMRVTKPGFLPLIVELAVDSERVKVEKNLEREPTAARVSVSSNASRPAALFVDGQRVGGLPWQGELAAGEHVIQARSQGHASIEHRVTLEKGAALNLNLDLVPLPATIRAFGGHPSATVVIDGNVVGHGNWEGTIAAGEHQIEFRRLGYHPRTETIRVEPGGVVVLPEPDLKPVLASQPGPTGATGQGSPMADQGADSFSSGADLERYRGVYAQLAVAGLFAKSTTNEIAADCPAEATGGSCESMAPVGGAASLRVGYSFGWLGVEGLALASGDVSRTSANYLRETSPTQGEFYGVARDEDYTFFRYGWGGGVALRATSPTGTLRLTGSLGGGFVQRSARYLRVAVSRDKIAGTGVPAGAKHLESEVATYVAPVLIADAGLIIGSSPGARLFLGGMLMVEAGQGQATVPGKEQRLGINASGGETRYGTPSIDVTRGPVVQFGPVLGVVFGS
jgi:hypothetical protein